MTVNATIASADRRAAVVRIFEAICVDGPIARGGLRFTVGASPSTITSAVQELMVRGFVIEMGTGESTGGRRPKILDLAPELGAVLAIDIGGINVRAGLADLRGSMLATRETLTPGSVDPDSLHRVVEDLVSELTSELPMPVKAVAVSVAGVVAPGTGKVSLAVNIPGWQDVDVERWFTRLAAPVYVDNEANFAALGERAVGCARDREHVLFVALGAGIGAGLILNGELFRGATGAAGEIGYLRIPHGDGVAELEREAGAAAVVARYKSHGGNDGDATAESVFTHAAGGDGPATAAVSEVVDLLAVGIANAIVTLDPRLVVIGGGLAAAGDLLARPLEASIAKLVPVLPEIQLSSLGPTAALTGAAWWGAKNARDILASDLEPTAVLV